MGNRKRFWPKTFSRNPGSLVLVFLLILVVALFVVVGLTVRRRIRSTYCLGRGNVNPSLGAQTHLRVVPNEYDRAAMHLRLNHHEWDGMSAESSQHGGEGEHDGAQVSPTFTAEVEKNGWSKAMWAAVQNGRLSPTGPDTVPCIVTPVMYDTKEFQRMLASLLQAGGGAPSVRLFVVIVNSKDPLVLEMVELLSKFPFGVHAVQYDTPQPWSFSRSMNTGIVTAIRKLTSPPPGWFFLVNADTFFQPGSLTKFATAANENAHRLGLIYGPKLDHFAFAVTHRAVEEAGFLDECFYPIYMEDIDYRWRVHLAGLGQLVSGADFFHMGSMSAKNSKDTSKTSYRERLKRADAGWNYGLAKWGTYTWWDYDDACPPSGYANPFNIEGAPVSFWEPDPVRVECIDTGDVGPTFKDSEKCWYNGSVMLRRLPKGTKLARELTTIGKPLSH